MDKINKQIAIAKRRLLVQRTFTLWIWSLCVCMSIAAVALGVAKLFPLNVEQAAWTWWWIGGAVVSSVTIAIGWNLFRGSNELEAAIEIDRRYELKERISSTCSLKEEERDTEVGRALIDDAARRIDRLDIANQFGLILPRRSWLAGIAAIVAFVLIFIPNAIDQEQANANAIIQANTKQIEQVNQQLKQNIIKKRKEAENKKLHETAKIFHKIEQGIKQADKKNNGDKKKAMVKLNNLANELKKRQEKIGKPESIKKQLSKLNKMKQGPADKLTKALRKGDFNQAASELKKLKEQLSKGNMSEEDKKKLNEQFKQMEQKLSEMAKAEKELTKQLQEQAKKQSGNNDSVVDEQIRRQLEKQLQKQPQTDQLDKLAKSLKECSSCMKKGDGASAKKAMDNIQKQLDEMQRNSEENDLLKDGMKQIASAKNSMNCKSCQGKGCSQCSGNKGNSKGNQGGAGDSKLASGDGLGKGRGSGARPEEKDDVKTFDSDTRHKLKNGKLVVTGDTGGPNLQNKVNQQIDTELSQAKEGKEIDPNSTQRLPKREGDQAREYIDALRKGFDNSESKE